MSYILKNNNFKIEYIDNQYALDNCVNKLSLLKEFAFDLEFDKDRYRYGFNLCLIQIATADECFIIDPMARINLDGLLNVFEDQKILKVVHCPGEDLRLLHSIKCYPQNIFDTEITAKLLNYEFTSLLSMLDLKLGIKIDKSLQKSNWSNRPLNDEQILYGASDVIYLLELKNQLEDEAIEKDIIDFLADEFGDLSMTIHLNEKKENFLKKEDIKYLSDYHQYKLNELLKLRDSIAEEFNKPSYQVIDERILRDITFDLLSPDEWLDLKGLFWKVKTDKYKKLLIKRLQEIEQVSKDMKLSKRPKSDEFLSKEELEAMKKLRKEHEKIKIKKFAPLQDEIRSLYGIHACKFILGEGLINDLLKNKIKISQIKKMYKKDLIKATADRLNIALDEYY